MRCVFVGNLNEDMGFLAEVLQEKGYELIQAGEFDRVEKTINPVIEAQAQVAVYDLLKLTDSPEEIVETIGSIQQSRGGEKIIFLAAGKGKNTPVIRALLKAGYANFVLDSTYGAKKEKFARCLTNFYESNAGRLSRELGDAGEQRTLYFTAFAGTQARIGTTTQAIQYAGYLADCGRRVCYVEENGDGLPGRILETYQYATESGGCVTYAGIPMYGAKPIQEMLKMNYDYFVLDMGDINRETFDGNLFFDSRVRRVIVAGAKPQEWPYTRYVCANALCRDAAYIISYASDKDIAPVSGAFETPPLFAGYAPDMFDCNQKDLARGYQRLFPEENKDRFLLKKEKMLLRAERYQERRKL